jgi:hypothetical protein
VAAFDWVGWHQAYDDPESSLSKRLAVVRRRIGECLDSAERAPLRIVSLCAGDGRDVLPELAARPGLSASTTLVEVDESLAARAADAAAGFGLADVQVLVGDAGVTASFADQLPADLLLLCGIFGNVADADIRNTLNAARAMVREGGHVIWTRGRFEDVDLRDAVRQWTIEAGFTEVAFDGAPANYGVGLYRCDGPDRSAPLPPRLFTFIR